MKGEVLNTRHIRAVFDYLEAEAATCARAPGSADVHRDFVNELKDFMQTYQTYLPVVAVPSAMPEERKRSMKEGFTRDWQAHQAAIETLRPLIDLLLAAAEGKPQEEQSRLLRAAFPHGTEGM